MQEEKREHWHSRLGLVFATCGSAIGLGTLWKLPYMVGQNGGGAFIFLFLLFTILLGMPLFAAELALGKINQKSITGIFFKEKTYGEISGIMGFIGILATLLIAGWYGVVSGWGIQYLLMALSDSFKEKNPKELEEIFSLFRQSGSLNLLWQIVFIAATCLILAKGVGKGIEKYSKAFFSLLFFLVIALFVYGTTLSGFRQALEYIIYPKFNDITAGSIIAALGLSLFSLSLGQGIMVTYGSYMPKNQNIFKTALLVSFTVVLISILISLMIFPMVFTFGFPPEAKESLLFITMPYVTQHLPGSVILAVLFFILLIFAALTSYMGQLEVLVSSLMESFNLKRGKSSIITGVICFIFGIPSALMMSDINPYPNFVKIFHASFMDISDVVINLCLILFSLGICFIVGFKIDKKTLSSSLNISANNVFFNLWIFLIRFLIPLSLLIIAFY